MKKILIVSAMALLPFMAMAHEVLDENNNPVIHSHTNGPIIPRESWDVYQARTYHAGEIASTPVVIATVKSEAEFIRLSMLETARFLVSLGQYDYWKVSSFLKSWMDRYIQGER